MSNFHTPNGPGKPGQPVQPGPPRDTNPGDGHNSPAGAYPSGPVRNANSGAPVEAGQGKTDHRYVNGAHNSPSGMYHKNGTHVVQAGGRYPNQGINSPDGTYIKFQPQNYYPDPAGGSFANTRNTGMAWQNDLRYRYSYQDKNTGPKKKLDLPPEVKKRLRRKAAKVVGSVILSVVLFIGGLMLVARHVGNESFISKYNKGVYDYETEGTMLRPNIPDGYVPLYNLGNAYYKNGDYEGAAAFYYSALEKDPPEIDEECKIRINLALALIHQINFNDLDTQQKVDRAITHLKGARGVLTEHGCANPKDDKGHSEDAEKLKKDIDEMLKKLEKEGPQKKNEKTTPTPTPKPNQNQNQQNGQTSGREQNLKSNLQQNQKQNMQQRQKTQRNMREWQGFGESGDPYSSSSSSSSGDGNNSPYETKNW
uniref:tetratricopeptide repeat protein n=1 Tax=Eubacterium cellulosolvens TaxID=29322 RepID=UPI000481D5D1|nr:tetratricopeptide repeat protein [[Eubacterium] cellulosolvens]